ncbi:endoplasmic reticulum lectin 1 isoform X1 [Leptopilina heterotoma]|uniref:endoplasmic reticulum lectin 1 isoform X1 n=1 Tax=Leptopilina heterotoma TaxID=63436 RepID=UPI001CA8997B|nr:endoplasmic reticulum lectin 1 isoform X1 [Leptopilina heterotoma]
MRGFKGTLYSEVLVLFVNLYIVYCHDLKAFDDTVLFKINWPGKSSAELLEPENVEPYFITTANNEKYQCFIPDTNKQESDQGETYTGPNPIEILTPLFNQKSCSYRLESYWTYELCHGRHVRQYHEEREGKKVNLQEFSLGTFDKTQKIKMSSDYDELAKNPNRKTHIPMKKVDGINMPYVEIDMSDGTMCDLNNKPRSTKVLYVCYQHGKHEIFSLKEISSCEYEAVVLSPLLCSHPDYKPQNTGENDINCRPVDDAPKRPKSLSQLDAESLKLRHQKIPDDDKKQKVYAIFHVDKEGQDGETRVRVEIRPMDILDKHYNIDETVNNLVDQELNLAKDNPVQNFLSGKNCLNGGNGWWKYEFCYGRSVMQYHLERDGTKTTVDLGKFDKEKHLKWIEAHPHKKPKLLAQGKQLSHFYSDGSICDKTGKLRQTEVKLKCVTNPLGSQSSVSLFLLEPKTCEYILGVESPLICNILQYADNETGLISENAFQTLESKKTNSDEKEEILKRLQNREDEL